LCFAKDKERQLKLFYDEKVRLAELDTGNLQREISKFLSELKEYKKKTILLREEVEIWKINTNRTKKEVFVIVIVIICKYSLKGDVLFYFLYFHYYC
jgi:hypothetical protein